MSKQGTLFVYSGPSGVGKGTLLAPCLARDDGLIESVSMTTREPRPGERDGVSYYFVTKQHFQQQVDSGGLLEYACYSGNYYGTPRETVERQLASGRDVVLEIEVQGAMQIKKTFPQAVFIFVLPPSFECLEQRLCARATETPEKVAQRLSAAHDELRYAGEYDYIIVNDDIDKASGQLAAIFKAAKCERRAMQSELDAFSLHDDNAALAQGSTK